MYFIKLHIRQSSNIYWDKTVTDPLLFFECYFFSGYMLTIFLFLFLLIQPLIWDKLLKGTWLFPLKTLLSFHLLFYIISWVSSSELDMTVPILQRNKLKLREVKSLAQGHEVEAGFKTSTMIFWQFDGDSLCFLYLWSMKSSRTLSHCS